MRVFRNILVASLFVLATPMAADLKSHTGTFLSGTDVVTTTFSVTGITDKDGNSFTGGAVFMWAVDRTEAVNTVGRADHALAYGMGVSSTDRRTVASASDDASASANSGHGARDDCVFHNINGSMSVGGRIDFQSTAFGDGTMNLVIDEQFGTSIRIGYTVWGGTNLTGAVTGQFTEPTTATTFDVTGLGINPSAVILTGYAFPTNPPMTGTDSRIFLGFAAGSTIANGVASGGSNDGAATMQTMQTSRSGESMILFDPGVVAQNRRGFVSSFGTGEFETTWNEVQGGGNTIYFYLALEGGLWQVDDGLTQTSTGLFSHTGVGINPSGMMLLSQGNVENAADTDEDDHELVLGMASDAATIKQHTQWIRDEDGVATSTLTTGICFDCIYQKPNTDGIVGEMQLVDFIVDGVQFDMTIGDPTTQRFWTALFWTSEPVMGKSQVIQF